MTRGRTAARLMLAGAALLLNGAALPPGARVALPDGRRIFMTCMGNGSPTVVLEAGFQSWSFAWD